MRLQDLDVVICHGGADIWQCKNSADGSTPSGWEADALWEDLIEWRCADTFPDPLPALPLGDAGHACLTLSIHIFLRSEALEKHTMQEVRGQELLCPANAWPMADEKLL